MAERQDERRCQALEFLMSGRSPVETAELIGVDRTTLWRWLKEDPSFVRELRERRAARAYAVQEQIRAAASDAVAYLRTLVTDREAPHSVRLKAATAILDRVGLAPGADMAGSCSPPTEGIESWPAVERRTEQARQQAEQFTDLLAGLRS